MLGILPSVCRCGRNRNILQNSCRRKQLESLANICFYGPGATACIGKSFAVLYHLLYRRYDLSTAIALTVVEIEAIFYESTAYRFIASSMANTSWVQWSLVYPDWNNIFSVGLLWPAQIKSIIRLCINMKHLEISIIIAYRRHAYTPF